MKKRSNVEQPLDIKKSARTACVLSLVKILRICTFRIFSGFKMIGNKQSGRNIVFTTIQSRLTSVALEDCSEQSRGFLLLVTWAVRHVRPTVYSERSSKAYLSPIPRDLRQSRFELFSQKMDLVAAEEWQYLKTRLLFLR